MSEIVSVKRKIFGKSSFNTVVDTSFSQLIPKDAINTVTNVDQVLELFNIYNNIFYDIPMTGSANTHLELVNRSSEYLGISYENLIEELRVTRDENVSLKNQLVVITGV